MSDFKNYLFERFIKSHKRLKRLISLTGYNKESDVYWGSSDAYEQYVAYEVWKHQKAIIDDHKNQLNNMKKRIDEISQALIDKADHDASEPHIYDTKRAYFQGISQGLDTFRHSIGLKDDLDKEIEGEHAE